MSPRPGILSAVSRDPFVQALRRARVQSCEECGRTFDLLVELDAQEWHYGHDCEVAS